MDSPLWTEVHAPELADLPQAGVREALQDAVDDPLNLVLHGPPGSGKTAAVRALARAAHEDPETDLIEINVADVFQRTKREILDDPRFSAFLRGPVEWTKRADVDTKYKRNWSKGDMINHVLTESAAHPPSAGSYNTVLLDNAEAIREDFQQALRRVMERHHRTSQFVITTRQPAKLIPPLRSRCLAVPVRAPTISETADVLERILEAEGVAYEAEGVEYLAGYGGGDLRRAVLGAQTTAAAAGEVTMTAAHDALEAVRPDDRIEGMVAAAEGGAFEDARDTLDDLLRNDGLSGEEVLAEVLRVARSRYAGEELARVYELAGEVDLDLVEGTDDRLHLSHFLAELPREAGQA